MVVSKLLPLTMAGLLLLATHRVRAAILTTFATFNAATSREVEIQTFLVKTVSKPAIAKMLGVSRSTLYHFIQSRRRS